MKTCIEFSLSLETAAPSDSKLNLRTALFIPPLSLRSDTPSASAAHCRFSIELQIDQSGTKLLLVESLRFRVLSVDLQMLLSTEPLARNASSPLTFCGESSTLPEGVTIFAEALPGAIDAR